MNKPKEMLSNKDVMYISDILRVTYTNIKKFNHFKQDICDKKILDLIDKVVMKLETQYDALLEVLNV